MPQRRAVKPRARKVKAKPKDHQKAKGRDIAQFRGTGSQVIIQMPQTRRQRRAPIRAAKAAAIPPQPPLAMVPRQDGLSGQQTTSDRLHNQIGSMQQAILNMRTEQARNVGEGNVLGGHDLGTRVNEMERAQRDLQAQLAGEQARLTGRANIFDARNPLATAIPASLRPLSSPSASLVSGASTVLPSFPAPKAPTVAQLRAALKEKGITGLSGMNKEALMDLASRHGLFQ